MNQPNPPLAYFVQEAEGIFLCVKHDESVGHWRFPISAAKALDLNSELARMVRVELTKRNK